MITFAFLTEADERALQRAKLFAERGHFVTQPHAHIERDLIVARAPRVELAPAGTRRVSSASMFI